MKPKKSRFLKAELLILFCVVVVWAVDQKTDCVRLVAGALRQIVRTNTNREYNHGFLDEDLARQEYEIQKGLNERSADELF